MPLFNENKLSKILWLHVAESMETMQPIWSYFTIYQSLQWVVLPHDILFGSLHSVLKGVFSVSAQVNPHSAD